MEAFSDVVGDLEAVESFGLSRHPVWQPRRGREQSVQVKYGQVAGRAGAAALAFDLSGVAIDFKPAGTMATRTVNPALAWSTIFDESPMVDPQLVSRVGFQVLGLLEERRAAQAERERGFVGALG